MAEDNNSTNKNKNAMAENPNTLHVLNQQLKMYYGKEEEIKRLKEKLDGLEGNKEI